MISKENVKSNLIDLLKKSFRIYKNHISFTKRYKFENRSKNKSSLCMILAGYKEFTWDVIFERIDKFSNDEMDICILSSGLYSERLSQIAKKYGWSYLSVKRNSVTLTQNTAIKLFPNAKFVYKIDEDIFVTKNFFKALKDTYEEIQENRDYNVGFVAPLIPLNGYSHVQILKELNLIKYYEEHFEKVKYAAGSDRMIENNANVAKFMWGENNIIPHIDKLDEIFSNLPFSYSAATVRFSIGAIYFSRELWYDMHYFKVDVTRGMGIDEQQICSYCISYSKAMIISENTCVGHLSFTMQNNIMKEYFKNHPEKFLIIDDA